MPDSYKDVFEVLEEFDRELRKTAVISSEFRAWIMMMARGVAIQAKKDAKKDKDFA